jgi:hypothetical protein
MAAPRPAAHPAFEIDGIGDDLLAEFSTPSADIDAAMRQLVAAFRADQGVARPGWKPFGGASR